QSIAEWKRLASEIQAKLDQGASFEEMVRLYSNGSQREEGGDWGWLDLAKLQKGLADVASLLKKGERSDIIGLAPQNGDYWIYSYDRTGLMTRARKYSESGVLLEEKKSSAQATLDANLPVPKEFFLIYVEDWRPAAGDLSGEAKPGGKADLQ